MCLWQIFALCVPKAQLFLVVWGHAPSGKFCKITLKYYKIFVLSGNTLK